MSLYFASMLAATASESNPSTNTQFSMSRRVLIASMISTGLGRRAAVQVIYEHHKREVPGVGVVTAWITRSRSSLNCLRNPIRSL